jgi:hypothetical protein
MKIFYTALNIFKVFYWVFILIASLNYLGTLYGIIAFCIFCFAWNIILTLIKEKQISDDSLLGILFTTSTTLPFSAYGCYCSPKYGVDGRTNGLDPVDELDMACKIHDDTMLADTKHLADGAVTKQQYVKLKNQGDWQFMKSAVTSRNSASGVYLIFLLIGFIFRIVSRTIAI